MKGRLISSLQEALRKPHARIIALFALLTLATIGGLAYWRANADLQWSSTGAANNDDYSGAMATLSRETRERLIGLEVKASIENANLRDASNDLARTIAVTTQMSSDIAQLPDQIPAAMRADLAKAAVQARKALHEGDRAEAIAALDRIRRTIHYVR